MSPLLPAPQRGDLDVNEHGALGLGQARGFADIGDADGIDRELTRRLTHAVNDFVHLGHAFAETGEMSEAWAHY